MAQFYQEGPHSYENWYGKIYKNGVLVPRENYQYIPSQVGGMRVDPAPISNPNVVPGLAAISNMNTGGIPATPPTITTPPADQVGVRNYLIGQGYDNTKIGWNQGANSTPSQVTYGGTPFLTPQTNIGGTTYDSVNNIMAGLKGAGLLPTKTPAPATPPPPAPPASPVPPIATALPAVSAYPVNEEVQAYQETDNTPAVLPAQLAEPAVPTTPPPVSTEEQAYQTKVADMLAQISQRISNPAVYNPENDPAYNVLRKKVSRDVAEEMISRGILKSTITRDDTSNAIAGLIPALQESFYSREQENVGNMKTLADMLSSQEGQLYGRRTGESQRLLDNLLALAGMTGNIGGQKTLAAKGQEGNLALAEGGLTGLYKGAPTLEAKGQEFNQGVAEAGLTGQYKGQGTLQSRELDLQAARDKEAIRQFDTSFNNLSAAQQADITLQTNRDAEATRQFNTTFNNLSAAQQADVNLQTSRDAESVRQFNKQFNELSAAQQSDVNLQTARDAESIRQYNKSFDELSAPQKAEIGLQTARDAESVRQFDKQFSELSATQQKDIELQTNRDQTAKDQWDKSFTQLSASQQAEINQQIARNDEAKRQFDKQFDELSASQKADIDLQTKRDAEAVRQFDKQYTDLTAAQQADITLQTARDQTAKDQFEKQYTQLTKAQQAQVDQAAEEFAWSKSDDNPAFKAQILQNQISDLELKNLPALQNAQLNKIIKETANIGKSAVPTELDNIRLEIARAELKELQNPNGTEAEMFTEDIKGYLELIQQKKLASPADAIQDINRLINAGAIPKEHGRALISSIRNAYPETKTKVTVTPRTSSITTTTAPLSPKPKNPSYGAEPGDSKGNYDRTNIPKG